MTIQPPSFPSPIYTLDVPTENGFVRLELTLDTAAALVEIIRREVPVD